MDAPYQSGSQHLADELAWLDLLLRREALRWRQGLPKGEPELLKGLCISDAEMDRLARPDRAGDTPESAALGQAAAAARERIDSRLRASRGDLPLPRLAHLFGLVPFERQVLVLCLAAETDARYGKMCAYLQDDVTRRRPSVDLALRLLCESPVDRARELGCFSDQGRLARSGIVRMLDGEDAPLAWRLLKLDEPLRDFLLGIEGPSRALAGCVRFAGPGLDWKDLRWPEPAREALVAAARAHLSAAPPGRKLVFHLWGPAGTGRRTFAAVVARALGAPLLLIDVREILARTTAFEDTLRAAFRESVLHAAAVYLEGFEPLLADDDRALSQRLALARAIDDLSWLTFIGTLKHWHPASLLDRHFCVSVELPAPNIAARETLWKTVAGSAEPAVDLVEWPELAAKFRFTPGQMERALAVAGNRARARGNGAVVTGDDLYDGCRAESNRRIGTLARKLEPRYGWPDIILPRHSLQQLEEICAHVRYRAKVYGTWGFDRRFSLGKGLCVLFHGPSGSGKTMAVEIVARELQLEAYKVDLSTVVSKYIGETEKNLSRIFEEAETSNAILFFDEADALFGKRSEVRDAHDRYANIEINYLLQRMEEFEGLAFMATNLRKNIDEAFFRRMHFAVEFPFPEAAERYRIWKRHFPPEAPVSADVDLAFLAQRFPVTGGHIKNIVVNAAFLAAAKSAPISMEHIVRATGREYEKTGRPRTEAEFAPYCAFLKADSHERTGD